MNIKFIKYVIALCRKTAGLLKITSFGIYIKHEALNCWKPAKKMDSVHED